MLNVHPSRAHDLITPDRLRIMPSRAISPYIDGFGNKCVRILAPPGQLRVACDTIVADSGKPDRVDLSAEQHAVADLPHDALVFLLASRYCETDLMMDKAWELFGRTPPGWRRGAVDLRFRSRAYHVWISRRRCDKGRRARFYRAAGGVPRLCSPRCHVLPVHEYPGAILHGLSGRYRRSSRSGSDGFQRLV